MQQQNLQTRMTKQRLLILEELRKLDTHPTADELYSIVREKLPKISLGTVYRNLDFLADSGQILRIENACSAKRFDGKVSNHQHIRCIHCGRIADVKSSVSIPNYDRVKANGFRSVVNTRIEFDGICDACAKILEKKGSTTEYM